MHINLLKADQRGHADLGWLKTHYSFSFSNYHNPRRIHFGMLRVLNDDYIEANMGFGMHPHDNMEIITIPTSGGLRHRDSMGHTATVHAGEVQVMSAGTGIYHSEINPYSQPVTLFQIWIFPDRHNVAPRYDQKSFTDQIKPGHWTLLVGPKDHTPSALWIHQKAFISTYRSGAEPAITTFTPHIPGHGLYLMAVEGSVKLENHTLSRRDSIEVTHFSSLTLHVAPATELLAIEVPMR